jgi:hypothetical protein
VIVAGDDAGRAIATTARDTLNWVPRAAKMTILAAHFFFLIVTSPGGTDGPLSPVFYRMTIMQK